MQPIRELSTWSVQCQLEARLVFPKNSSGVGFSFSFLEKGAWSESGRTVPVRCPSGAGSSRFLALVYAKRSFFGKCRSRLRETDILLAPIRPAALSSTRNGHFNIKYRSRLRETVPWPSPESSRALSSTRNGHFNRHKISLSSTRNGLLAVCRVVRRALVYAKRPF